MNEGHTHLHRAYFKNYICISGDELFSDTYPMKLVDDCLYEVYGKVSVKCLRVETSLVVCSY